MNTLDTAKLALLIGRTITAVQHLQKANLEAVILTLDDGNTLRLGWQEEEGRFVPLGTWQQPGAETRIVNIYGGGGGESPASGAWKHPTADDRGEVRILHD